jgi:hypothetical protein
MGVHEKSGGYFNAAQKTKRQPQLPFVQILPERLNSRGA